MPFFDEDRIDIPTRNNINLWADYVERLAVFSVDYEISKDGFMDILTADSTRSAQQINGAFSFNHQFLNDLIEQNIPLNNVPENDDENGDPDAIALDEIDSKADTLFAFIKARQTLFGNYYPFTLQGNVLSLAEPAALTNNQKAYLILLLSSDLKLYTPADINSLGHAFEAFCAAPFDTVTSKGSLVSFFGAGAGTTIPIHYVGNLHDRIVALSRDLAFTTNELIEDPDEIAIGGDAGLDWVGWLNFPDQLNHQTVFFGQCACGSNWVDKQHETHPSRWRNYLVFNQPINCVHMMPHSFRRNNGKWLKETSIEEVIMLDRLRLLHLLNFNGNFQIHPIHATLLNEAFNLQLD